MRVMDGQPANRVQPEIDIRCSSVPDAMSALVTDAQILSVGSESCLHKLPSIREIRQLAAAAADRGKKLKCVIPFVPQCHLDSIKQYLAEYLDSCSDIHLVINDYGILYYLSRIAEGRVTLTVGRFLERTFELLPWKDNVIRDECEDVRRAVTQSTFAHEPKLRLLRKMGVSGIELNYAPSFTESYRNIRSSGLKVIAHAAGTTLAFTRACPIRRMVLSELKEGESCAARCISPVQLAFRQKWIPLEGHQEGRTFDNYVNDPEISGLFPEMYARGNLIYREAVDCREDLETADGWIVEDAALNTPLGEHLLCKAGEYSGRMKAKDGDVCSKQ